MKSLVLAGLAVSTAASAEPLRLRGDALAAAQSPTGLVALTAEGELEERVRAETLLWMGADSDDGGEADALVATVEVHDAGRRIYGKAGRYVLIAGALRPVHLDGLHARARLPARFTVEAFGGVPVVPRLSGASWDWAAGGRASRLVGDWGSIGVSYLQQRDHGRLDASEAGVDGSAALGKNADLGARVAVDAIHGGVNDAFLTATVRRRTLRGDLYLGERSAAHLLPATSLFTVIGDVPSRRGGVGFRWRAAPRLDLRGTAGAIVVDDDPALDLTARAELRLDDRGAGVVGVELRRSGGDGGNWTGVRAIGRRPVRRDLTLAAEVELVVPDRDDPAMDEDVSGEVWPWALAAASWRRGEWEVAGAVEASSSPIDRYRVDGLVRVGRTWEVR